MLARRCKQLETAVVHASGLMSGFFLVVDTAKVSKSTRPGIGAAEVPLRHQARCSQEEAGP
jgi:hypothetical protein